jgi:hypothetical protein
MGNFNYIINVACLLQLTELFFKCAIGRCLKSVKHLVYQNAVGVKCE